MTFPTIDLPPHDPNRHQTTDGFDDSEMTNGTRAEHARNTITGDFDDPSDISDLITNLLHFAHSEGHDPNDIQSSALGNFYAEAGPLPLQS